MVQGNMRPLAILLAPAMLFACTLPGQTDKESNSSTEKPTPTIAARTASMQRMPGLLPLDWDAKSGKLYLEVPLSADAAHTRSQDLLYTDSLPYGTGSNDLGLDRGQISEGRIVHFERTGPKLLLVEPNAAFRTSSTDPAEKLAVLQSFPESVLGGFKVEAESPDGTVLVDATDFFLRDVHHVAQALVRAKQGSYKVDASRSTIALDHTRAFPKNTEVEAELTFALEGEPQGHFVSDVTPDPAAMTVREHQSFLELPPPGFTPRRFSPRAGYFPASYRELNAPLGDSLDQNFIIRHRLIKRDPNCTHACVAVAPIQYYVDWRAGTDPHGPAGRRPLVGYGLPGRRLGARDLPSGICCPRALTRWTCALTSSSGCIATRADGATAQRSRTRAPARSSRAM